MALPTTISHEKLARLIGTPACPVLLDVRTRADLQADPHLIPGSKPRDWERVAEWGDTLRGQSVVVICRDGRANSHGVAAWLRSQGVAAEALEGERRNGQRPNGPWCPSTSSGTATRRAGPSG